MGLNSTVLILNDSFNEIEQDPKKFVEEMLNNINQANFPREGYEQTGFDPGQSKVMSCAHADMVTILAVGGNHATQLGQFYNNGIHHTEEAQVQLLRGLADKYGYSLRKKPTKKGKA